MLNVDILGGALIVTPAALWHLISCLVIVIF